MLSLYFLDPCPKPHTIMFPGAVAYDALRSSESLQIHDLVQRLQSSDGVTLFMRLTICGAHMLIPGAILRGTTHDRAA